MDNIEVRRAMAWVLLSTADDCQKDGMLMHSVRVLEKFVSDKTDVEYRRSVEAANNSPVKKLGISPRKLVIAEKFLRTGFKSRVEIANHLNITTDTVKTKVLPNIRRVHNVERKRFGVTGRYKYRIA